MVDGQARQDGAHTVRTMPGPFNSGATWADTRDHNPADTRADTRDHSRDDNKSGRSADTRSHHHHVCGVCRTG